MGIREPREPACRGGTQGATPTLVLGCLLLLAGCGRPPGAPAADTEAAPDSSAAASNTAAPSDEPPPNDADLVSAVAPAGSNGGSDQSVSVKFRLEGRPIVGMPVKILVALIPTTDGDVGHIHGSFSAGDGLAVQSPQTFDIADLHGGASQYREVTVLPQQTGVLNLNATLLLQSDTTTRTRTYSIPLIAADNSGS
jgi:hypothetical protein